MISIRRNTTPIKMRNYGRIVQDVISYACTLTDKQERQALTAYVAQCMRQKNLVWNKDQESGIDRIKQDIHILSDGRLDDDLQGIEALMSNAVVQPQQGQSKKKKK